MGLDVVEVVLECEEKFDIQLEDWRLGQMRTVGELYELVCEQLQLPFGENAPSPKTGIGIPILLAPVGGWSRDTVWSNIVQICVDQLQTEEGEIRYDSRFSEDLGAD